MYYKKGSSSHIQQLVVFMTILKNCDQQGVTQLELLQEAETTGGRLFGADHLGNQPQHHEVLLKTLLRLGLANEATPRRWRLSAKGSDKLSELIREHFLPEIMAA